MRVFTRVAFACLAGAIGFASPANSAQKTALRPEAAGDGSTTSGVSQAPHILPTRQVELVVVWGFRLRTTQHDLRMQSVRSGYSELIEKAACITAVCGFVVVQDGTKWRATNVITASEEELYELERNMERDNAILVIVHPTGQKRTVPEF